MKNLLSILGAVSLTATGTSNVIACKQPHKKQNLNEIFKDAENKKIGPISFADDKPEKVELLAAIKEKNPSVSNLTINDFDIASTPAPTADSATIIGKGKYTGTVSLSYIKIAQQLDSVITITTLGEITMEGEVPTTAELEAAIKEKNPSVSNLTINDFDIASTPAPTADSATIIGKGKYTGTVSLSYRKQ